MNFETDALLKINIMKKLNSLYLILTLFMSNVAISSFGQDYSNLLMMLTDEEYEKCFVKAVKYTENDKTSKDPLPYFYAAEASFRMSQDNDFKDDYPKAFKSSLSYLGKYRKKDKHFEYKEDVQGFYEEIKMNLIEEIQNNIEDGGEKAIKNALGLTKKIEKFDKDCPGTILLSATFSYQTNNKTDGKEKLNTSMERIKAIGTDVQFGDMSETQQLFLKVALMTYAKYKMKKFPEDAKNIISLGHQYFYERTDDLEIDDIDDFKALYDEITG